jgi:hypothetical protein
MPRKVGTGRKGRAAKPACHGPPTKRARHCETAPGKHGALKKLPQLLDGQVAGNLTSLLGTFVDDISPEVKADICDQSVACGHELARLEMVAHQQQESQHQNHIGTPAGLINTFHVPHTYS